MANKRQLNSAQSRGSSNTNILVRVETQDRKSVLFRFGQYIYPSNFEYLTYRDPLASELTYGVFETAFTKGFDLTEEETDKILEDSNKLWKFIERNLTEILQAGRFERTKGFALLIIKQYNDTGTVKSLDDVYLRAISPDAVEDRRQDKHGRLAYIKFKEQYSYPIDGADLSTDITFETGENIDIDNIIYINLRRKETTGSSQSWLEPIFDELMGYSILRESGIIFGIRAGAGIKVVKVDRKTFNDSEEMDRLYDNYRDVGAVDSVIVIPTDGSDEAGEADFSIESVDQIDFLALRDFIVSNIALYSGFPKNTLFGEEGSRVGAAEVNVAHESDTIQTIQQQYSHNVFLPIFRRIGALLENYSYLVDTDYSINFGKKEAPSKTELAEERTIEMDALDKQLKMYSKLLSMGATPDDAQEKTGIDLLLEQAPNPIMENSDDTNDDPSQDIDDESMDDDE